MEKIEGGQVFGIVRKSWGRNQWNFRQPPQKETGLHMEDLYIV
jgi:hypothetical protein